MAGLIASSMDPARNWGVNVEANKKIAAETGYTGPFGGGEYQKWQAEKAAGGTGLINSATGQLGAGAGGTTYSPPTNPTPTGGATPTDAYITTLRGGTGLPPVGTGGSAPPTDRLSPEYASYVATATKGMYGAPVKQDSVTGEWLDSNGYVIPPAGDVGARSTSSRYNPRDPRYVNASGFGAGGVYTPSAAPEQNFGENAALNRQLTDLTGYQGDYDGKGGFQEFNKTLSPDMQAQVAQLTGGGQSGGSGARENNGAAQETENRWAPNRLGQQYSKAGSDPRPGLINSARSSMMQSQGGYTPASETKGVFESSPAQAAWVAKYGDPRLWSSSSNVPMPPMFADSGQQGMADRIATEMRDTGRSPTLEFAKANGLNVVSYDIGGGLTGYRVDMPAGEAKRVDGNGNVVSSGTTDGQGAYTTTFRRGSGLPPTGPTPVGGGSGGGIGGGGNGGTGTGNPVGGGGTIGTGDTDPRVIGTGGVDPFKPISASNPAAGYQSQNANVVNSTSQGYQSRDASAVNAGSQGYDAAQWKVTPEQQVEDRLNRILGIGSPLMEQAATQARQAANERGLINSSMAVTAGQDAMIRSALPIAQQDAQTNASAGQFNAGATNSARAFTAGASNTAALQNASQGTQVNLSNAGESNKANAFGAQAANTSSNTNAQLGTQTNAANATEANKAGAFGAGARNAQTLAQLEADSKARITTLDAASKERLAGLDAASREEIARLNASTQEKLANLDSHTRMSIENASNYNKQLLQTNSTAAAMQNQFATIIANIQNSKDYPDAQSKTDAMNKQLEIYKSGLDTIGNISGFYLGRYFADYEFESDPGTGGVDPYVDGRTRRTIDPNDGGGP